ncbi:MAG: ABC transporter permease [Nanoarchaeota archaeon]
MRKEYFTLALGSLRKRRLRSWLTMLGVIIGIAAVISLIGIGEGLRNFVSGQFNVLDTNVLSISAEGTGGPPGAGVINPLTERQRQAISRVKGIDIAIGRIIEFGFSEFNDKTHDSYFASVPSGQARDAMYDIANYEIEKGRLLKDGDTTRIVVGADYADKDTFGKPVEVGSRLSIDGTAYTVTGILKRKGSFMIDNTIIMNEEQMQTQFSLVKDEYDVIAARVKDGEVPKAVKVDVEKVLRKERNVKLGEEDFSVQTAESALQNLNDVLFAVQLFISIIAAVSLVVGGIGIMNTMFTAVLERTQEIGIMKAIGARNSNIFILFAIESGLIGLVGGILGILIGSAMAYGLSFGASSWLNQDITASISPALILIALGFSFFLGTLAGIIPAFRAAHLHPVDALREGK